MIRELCREQKDTSGVSMRGDGGCDDHGPGGGAENGDCQDGREVHESQDPIKHGQAKYALSLSNPAKRKLEELPPSSSPEPSASTSSLRLKMTCGRGEEELGRCGEGRRNGG